VQQPTDRADSNRGVYVQVRSEETRALGRWGATVFLSRLLRNAYLVIHASASLSKNVWIV
jgi:hypothetical protein